MKVLTTPAGFGTPDLAVLRAQSDSGGGGHLPVGRRPSTTDFSNEKAAFAAWLAAKFGHALTYAQRSVLVM